MAVKDIRCQHSNFGIANSGGTITLGTPVKIESAFIIHGGSRQMSSGYNSGFGSTSAGMDDCSMYFRLVDRGDGFAEQVDVVRFDGSTSVLMRGAFTVVEYIGDLGGPNEFKTLQTTSVTFIQNSTNPSSTFTINNPPVNKDKVIPINQGILAPFATQNVNYTGYGALMLSDGVTIECFRGGDQNAQAFITQVYAVVEFTGSNWSTFHSRTGVTTSTGSVQLYLDSEGQSGTLMPSELLKANMVPFGSDFQGIFNFDPNREGPSFTGTLYTPNSSTDPLKNNGTWQFQSSNVVTGGLTKVLHVLHNAQMEVLSGSVTSASTNTSISISSLNLTGTEEAAVVANSIAQDSSASFLPTGFTIARLPLATLLNFYQSLDQAQIASGDVSAVIQYYVIKWPQGQAVEAIIQNDLEVLTTEVIGSTPERALVSNTLEVTTTDIQVDKNPSIGTIENTLEITTTLIQVPQVAGPCDVNKEGPLDTSDINLSNDAC